MLTVVSPVLFFSSAFIFENWRSEISPWMGISLMRSPSAVLKVNIWSSPPSAKIPSLLQAPHVIFFVCFPATSDFLKMLMKMYTICCITYNIQFNLTMHMKSNISKEPSDIQPELKILEMRWMSSLLFGTNTNNQYYFWLNTFQNWIAKGCWDSRRNLKLMTEN